MSKTIIANVTVFDGDSIHGPATVIVKGGIIASVTLSPAEEKISQPSDIETINTIDGTGQTLLPGFIDSHVHVDKESAARVFPSFGITTVLDMGTPGDISILKSLAADPTNGLPSFLSAGMFATAPSSMHARMFSLRPEQTVQSIEDVESFVAARVDQGSDYVKVIADVPGFEDEALSALVAAAHRHGKKIVAHAAAKQSYERAVRAGFDIITHMPTDAELEDDTIRALAASGVVVVPTIAMMDFFAGYLNKVNPGLERSVETALSNLKRMHEAGVIICVGTDSNDNERIRIAYGETLHGEMEYMARCGIGNLDILRSATSEPAKRFGLDGKGRIAEGYRADVILVDGHPAEDIAAAKNVKRVWLAGVEIDIGRAS